MNDVRLNVLKTLACIAAIALASCSKLSDVGNQDEPAPKAVATSIGQEFTSDSNGNMTVTVRAGADVVLSGKESEKGADDSGVPLINFKWQQNAGDAVQVRLINRTANTVTFSAPQVTQDTSLHFTLTVSDAKNATSTAQATVNIKNIRDPDHFLQYLNQVDNVSLVLATAQPVAAASGAAITDTLPVTVTMTKLITFKDRTGVTQTDVPLNQPVVVNSGWSAQVGSSDKCVVTTSPADDSANKNPTIKLPIPRLNMDDKLATTLTGFPDAVVLSDVLEASDISDDTVKLKVRFDVTSTSNAVVTAGGAKLCIGSDSPVVPVATGAVRETEVLMAGLRDSKESARAYYNTINPSGEVQKTTLDIWLTENGFTPAVNGYGADAHAVYTNNFDLGFGRDMYMKFGACDAGTAATLPLQQRIGKCDVAAVVLNSSGVESAAKKLNPFAAVAMEYTRLRKTDTTGARFVKFYTFAPDTRTGDFRRVLSLNFDRRGEQYMPQACIACHGGVPGTFTAGVAGAAGTYANNGDVNATFLPWDLDSFLYSDTDPGFSSKARNADLRSQYTRAQQLTQFKRLNEGAYLTYADPAAITGRFALAKELVEGWYGGAGLPNVTFNGAFVPNGWKAEGVDGVAGTADDIPSAINSETLYKDVFARNCRACHLMHVPVSGDPRTATVNVPVTPGTTTPTTAVAACSADTRLKDTRVGVASQAPMGCYWEFIHAPNLADRLSRNQMPFARRTSDRMWVSSTAPSAGVLLQTTLAATSPSIVVTTPGTAVAGIAASPTSADVDDSVTLDASSSIGADSLLWNVDACTGTASAPGTCTRAVPVVGSNNLFAKFKVDGVLTYRVTQTLNGGTPNAVSYFQVVNKTPVLTPVSTSTQIGTSIQMPNVITSLGNGSAARHVVALTPPAGITVSACTAQVPCSGDTYRTAMLTPTVTTPTAAGSPLVLGVSVMDAGGDASPTITSVSLAVVSTIAAPDLSSSTLAVSANAASNTTFNLLALTPYGARTDINIAGVAYTGSRTPLTSSSSGNSLTYRPAAGFATHNTTGNRPNSAPQTQPALETYAYHLERRDGNGNVIEISNTAQITIQVRARVSFAQAKNTWPAVAGAVGSCAQDCHAPGSAYPTAPKFNATLTYSDFIGGHLSLGDNRAYINTANVAQSGLLCWPETVCGNTHTGSVISATILDTVRQWIEDGANNF